MGSWWSKKKKKQEELLSEAPKDPSLASEQELVPELVEVEQEPELIEDAVSILSFIKEPTPALQSLEDILESEAAQEKIQNAFLEYPPGCPSRWNSILDLINLPEEPSESNRNPVNIHITMDILRKLISELYANITSIDSKGVSLMRKYMPELYAKHTTERGKRAAQADRAKYALAETCYSYGELDYEIFATIYSKLEGSYGVRNELFVDLGSGVGTIVYGAAFIGKFELCCGYERLRGLYDRGQKRERIWRKMVQSYSFPSPIRDTQLRFYNDDFVGGKPQDDWTMKASLVFLHWTAFSKQQIFRAAQALKYCQEGCMCITLTHKIPEDADAGYELMEQGICETSWGEAEYFLYEKTME